ncbi:MAG: V-type ATP synthase subunit D [Candidatus Bipolaricaulia bacterium]
MAEARVNATRMELLKQRKRLRMAVRGHKLLKDKRDELMRRFLELVEETRGVREQVEERLIRGFQSFLVARAEMSREFMEESLMTGAGEDGRLTVEADMVMNVRVPHFNLHNGRDIHSYGFASTSAELDRALSILDEVLPDLIRLASIEKSLELLAGEIERTRRRVNALEHIFIPQLQANIKQIEMALDEMERSTHASLMRIKEIIRGEV